MSVDQKPSIKQENVPNIKNDIYHALTYFGIGNDPYSDLWALTCGHEKCAANKPPEGPQVLGYYVLHYVTSGKGTFTIGGKTFEISKDTMFMLFPNEKLSYQQDINEPWEYYWTAFSGKNAKNYVERCMFSVANPIYKASSEVIKHAFERLESLKKLSSSIDIKALAIILDILSTVIEERRKNEKYNKNLMKDYVTQALSYIELNYNKASLTLIEVSAALNINPNYLSRLFTSVLNMPFSKYLIMLRLQKACALIKNTDMYFKTISSCVGYDDNLYFSRIFKKYLGVTPKEYRENIE